MYGRLVDRALCPALEAAPFIGGGVGVAAHFAGRTDVGDGKLGRALREVQRKHMAGNYPT
jgi:hypothetical protein